MNTKEMRSNCFNNLLTALNIADRYQRHDLVDCICIEEFSSLLILFFILDILREELSPAHYAPLLPLFPYLHFPMLRVRS